RCGARQLVRLALDEVGKGVVRVQLTAEAQLARLALGTGLARLRRRRLALRQVRARQHLGRRRRADTGGSYGCRHLHRYTFAGNLEHYLEVSLRRLQAHQLLDATEEMLPHPIENEPVGRQQTQGVGTADDLNRLDPGIELLGREFFLQGGNTILPIGTNHGTRYSLVSGVLIAAEENSTQAARTYPQHKATNPGLFAVIFPL